MVTFGDLKNAWTELQKNKEVLLPTRMVRSLELQKRVPGNLQIYLKPENLQRTGSYKVRGAFNKLRLIEADAKHRGVIAASAGNHAQGVAYAATHFGIRCRIVMPETAPKAKRAATEDYGVEVLLRGASFDQAYEAAKNLANQSGEFLIEAFDDDAVVAGQGTVALEIEEELPAPRFNVGMILVPAGGGGLLAGTCIAARELYPNAQVIAVQSEQNQAIVKSIEMHRADPTAVERHIDESTKPSIADGTRVKAPGNIPWSVLKTFNQLRGVTVTETEIQSAVFFLFEKCHLLVEGAGALGVAALLSGKIKPAPNATIAIILSGGNIDITKVAAIVESQLTTEGRYSTFCVDFEDAPGRLLSFLRHVSDRKINIMDIRRVHAPSGLSHSQARMELVLETNNAEDADATFRTLSELARSQPVDAAFEIKRA